MIHEAIDGVKYCKLAVGSFKLSPFDEVELKIVQMRRFCESLHVSTSFTLLICCNNNLIIITSPGRSYPIGGRHGASEKRRSILREERLENLRSQSITKKKVFRTIVEEKKCQYRSTAV